MAKMKPQVIDDEQHERVYERVAAVDVAKDSGMVCTRTPHPSRPGARQSTVWTVKARMAAIGALGRQLKRDGIQMVTLEATSDYVRSEGAGVQVGGAVGGPAEAGGVVPGPVRDGLSPPWRASRVTAGCEARGRSRSGRCSIRGPRARRRPAGGWMVFRLRGDCQLPRGDG